MEWDIDLSEVYGLRSWYGKQPKLMARASAMLLNEFAFGVRRMAVQHLARVMTVRNQRFVDTRMKVTKTSIYAPIAQQRAITGSIRSQRFTGWTEQEKGTPTERHRFATLAGRGGSIQKQIRPSVRLKPSNDIITIADYHPKGGATNYGGMFAMMLRKKETRLVRIKANLFKRNRSKVEFVQRFKTKQPKRLAWLRQARAIYFRKNDPQTLWAKQARAVMKPPPKK